MNWFRVPKENAPQALQGKHYWDWKEDLSKEGREQCVYCTININTFGGIRNFHVEHYRPKSKNPELVDDYANLFFACSICNGFKSDDWKNEPSSTFNNSSYPDPSKVDYSSILTLNLEQIVESEYLTGKYIIHKLFLNRPQLILERKAFYLYKVYENELLKLKDILVEFRKKHSENILCEHFIKTIEGFVIVNQGKYINPYTQAQIQRDEA